MASDDDKKTTDDSRFRELSPGKLLVWARERAGLTQEQVAKELYMTMTKVRALESDDYRHMGSDTFARGYIRAYANLVKLDVVQVLSAYDRHAQKHGLVEQVVPRRAESPNKPIWKFILFLLLVLAIAWLISIWFFDNRQKTLYNKPAIIVPPAETVMSAPVIQQRNSSSEIAQNSFNASGSSLSQISSVAGLEFNYSASASSQSLASSSVTSSQVQSTEYAPKKDAGGLDTIFFSFTEECWLEVSDANGDVLIADLQSAGNQLTLKGVSPFDVKLGNAPAVKMQLNGDTIEVVPALGTNVLSLKVGTSKSERYRSDQE